MGAGRLDRQVGLTTLQDCQVYAKLFIEKAVTEQLELGMLAPVSTGVTQVHYSEG